jgi:alpha-beta hydrolase superfamily lysophospholipase
VTTGAAHVDHGLTRDGVVQLRRRWATTSPRAAMLLLHGIGEHSGRYEHVGRGFASAGIEVVAIDHRGFGGSGGRRGHIRSFRTYVDDAEDQLTQVRTLGLPTVLFGHSMGGLIALLTVLEHREPGPDLLVLSAPALAAAVPAPLRALTPLAARLAPGLPVPSPIGMHQLATDPDVGRAYLADPVNVRTASPTLGAELLRSMRWANAHLDELDVPTLVVHGGDDHLVPTASSAPLAARPGVERRVLPGLRHEVCNEPGNTELVADIARWIFDHIGR